MKKIQLLVTLSWFPVVVVLGEDIQQQGGGGLRPGKARNDVVGLLLPDETESSAHAANNDKVDRELQTSCSPDRCGSTWSEANSNCQAPACDRSNWNDPVCGPGGYCYGSLSTACCSTTGSCDNCGNGQMGNGKCSDASLCCSEYGYCGTGISHCGATGTCGGGTIGNGICADRSLCCSEWGYCGSSDDHCRCSSASTPTTQAPASTTTTTPTTQAPVSTTTTPAPLVSPTTPAPVTWTTCQFCGNGNVGNGVCEDRALCCSKYGYCGASKQHCSRSKTSCGNGNRGTYGLCVDPTQCCSDTGYCGPVETNCPECAASSSPTTSAPIQSPSTNAPTTAATAATTCTSPRCGLDWADANSKCGTPCTTSDAPCPANERCYADVSLDLACCNNNNSSPTTQAPVSAPPPPSPSGDSARLISFVGNWQRCPTAAEIASYTHLIIAFAVSYSWNGGPVCNSDCSIPEPPTCGNAVRKDLIAQWKAAGKTVLLSFGGAAMGGSWIAPPNGCWEYCYQQGPYVIQRLKDIVVDHGYDGVDIDYEYYYDNKAGFTKGAQARSFLTEITSGLKDTLPAGSNIVTHAPMDADVLQGTGYYNLLKSLAQTGKLNFLMPQYYNGVSFPKTDFIGTTLPNYNNLVMDMFSGDATRVVFGFCVAECAPYDTTGAQASNIMTQVGQYYPCNGGAYFWEFLDDMPNNAWSNLVHTVLQIQAGSCP